MTQTQLTCNMIKLIISTKVEQKISICCRELPHNEWSGTLFYRVQSGSFGNNLILIADDFFLRDIGSHTYTEFDDDAEAFNYQIENGLEDDIQALIHSHCDFQTFFSGTDSSTLEEFGKLMPHFLSLIVNNKGEYCAKITRRIPVANHYLTFNGEEVEYQGDECVVQNFPVEVVFQDESIISETKAKLKELQSKFDSLDKVPTLWNDYDDSPYFLNNSNKSVKTDFKENSKGNNKEDNKINNKEKKTKVTEFPKTTKKVEKVSNTKSVIKESESLTEFIQKKVKSLLFGSCLFNVSKDFDLKDWCENKMEKVFDTNFKDYSSLDNWITICLDNLVLLCISKFPNTEDNPEIIGNIIDDYLKSLPQNTYIKEFRDHLIDVMYEYTV